MRYQRQEMLPDFNGVTALLHHKKVGIVGVGGLGGLCSYLLVGAGVLNLNIADGDTVSLSNLHRQILYREADIGKEKALCCKRELEALDSRVKVQTFSFINEDNFVAFAQNCDLILDLSDNVTTRLFISDACCRNRIDYIHAAVGGYQGILSAFWYSDPSFLKECGCYRCFSGLNADLKTQGILGPAAAMMSSAAAMLTLQVLKGNDSLKGYIQFFDLKNNAVRKMKLSKDSSCPVCREHK